ncbi:MFS transporter [Planosporangium sp. 12N6]|uniref:MFS transporter n=1 Tax=Planosporangium spinosum TaxID=3402278 RepID=UPI003CF2489A
MRSRLSTTFRSLKVRNFRLFSTGQLVKLIGVWMQFTAQDWLVLQLSHQRPTALGTVTALQFLPVLALTLYGGKLADRFDKRKLLIAVNAAFAVVAAVLGVLVATDVVQLWHVFAVALVTGVINAIEAPVRQSFVSELVGRDLLPNALALSAATFNSARIVGPAVAGAAMAMAPLGTVFLANAVMCVGPLVSALRMRPEELYRAGVGKVEARDARIVDGLRYTWSRQDLVLPMMLVLVVGMFGFNFPVTLAVLAGTVFKAGPQSFGLLSTALAVGALGGALAGSGRRSRPSVYIVLVGALAFGVLETLVAFAPTYLVAAGLLVPTGFFMMYFAQAANQRIQLGTTSEFRGRVVALYTLVFLGTTPFGAMIIGWAAERFGPRSGMWIGGVVSLLAGLVVSAVHLRRAHAEIGLHLRPRPHVHVREPAPDGAVIDFRVPAIRPAAR